MVFSEALLEETLFRITSLMADCRDRWCIFGGAALYLHGYRNMPFSDVDILASTADCERLRRTANIGNDAEGGTNRFRSKILLHPKLGIFEVEIMGDFEIFAKGAWQPVYIEPAVKLQFGSATVPVASLEKIASILRLSGREKDFSRLALIGRPDFSSAAT